MLKHYYHTRHQRKIILNLLNYKIDILLKTETSKSNLKLQKMNNVKILILGIAIAISSSAFPQTKFGVKAGLNLSNMSAKIDGDKDDDTKMKLGYNFGIIADYYFSDVLGLESGLIFETKGYEYRFEDDGDLSNKAEYGKLKTKVTYIDIPINLKAQSDMGNAKIFGHFGPYLGFAISGRVRATGDLRDDMDDMGFDTDESLEFGGSAKNDDLKRFDFGLMFGAGVGVGNFEIGAGYDLGLANILPGGDIDNYIRNGVLKFSVTYYLRDKIFQSANSDEK